MKLTCMRGYSGSGKSTRAAEIVKETGAVVVCRDDLRKMLLGAYWTGKKVDEDRVTVAEEAQISALLNAGAAVIVDATHLNPPYLRKWARLATRFGVDFEVVDVHADVDECKRRDHARMVTGGRYVGDGVIDRQASQWPTHKWPTITSDRVQVEPYIPDVKNPPAIIVDIDGTLAHATTRSPYDYSKVSEDRPDLTIINLVEDWWWTDKDNRKVLIVSGRDNTCYIDTQAWLHHYGVPYDELFMRPVSFVDSNGGKAPDWIVKLHLFNEHIRDEYDVQFVLDDRTQVVELWRKLGLKCLQVADGDF